MVHDLNIKNLFECGFDVLDAWIAKFNYLTSIRNNNMIVLLILIGLFEVRCVLTELIFPHQVAVEKQFYGIV